VHLLPPLSSPCSPVCPLRRVSLWSALVPPAVPGSVPFLQGRLRRSDYSPFVTTGVPFSGKDLLAGHAGHALPSVLGTLQILLQVSFSARGSDSRDQKRSGPRQLPLPLEPPPFPVSASPGPTQIHRPRATSRPSVRNSPVRRLVPGISGVLCVSRAPLWRTNEEPKVTRSPNQRASYLSFVSRSQPLNSILWEAVFRAGVGGGAAQSRDLSSP